MRKLVLSPLKILATTGRTTIPAHDVLKYFLAQGQVGNDFLEPVILVFQLSQALHLRRPQTRVFLALVEIGRLAEPGFPAQVNNRLAVFLLLDDKRLLRVREPRCFNPCLLLPSQGMRNRKL